MSVGPAELVVILLVVLLFFGSRLAGIGKGLGDGIREFKRGISGESDDSAKAKQVPAEVKSSPQSERVGTPAELGETVEPPVDASREAKPARQEGPGSSTAEPRESDKK